MGPTVILVFVVFSQPFSATTGLFLPPVQCNYQNVGARILADCRQRRLTDTNLNLRQQTEVLDLTENEIQHLHNDQFQDSGLSSLQELIVRNNLINMVDEFTFRGLINLVTIDLSYNKIAVLPRYLFSTNTNLRTLNLSHNPALRQVKDSIGTYHLQSLDLSSCHLIEVPHAILYDAMDLRQVNLAANDITTVFPTMFSILNKIESLQIHRNPINCNNDAEQLKQWLIESRIDFHQFCNDLDAPEHKLRIPEPPMPKTPPPRQFMDNNYSPPPCYDTHRYEKKPWYESGVILVMCLTLSIVDLGLLMAIMFMLRGNMDAGKRNYKDSYAAEESLPPYI